MILIEQAHEYRCEWVSNSERCHYAGTISHSTLGSGPWYCHDHFRCNDALTGAAIVMRSAREYPTHEWTVATVRTREYPASDPMLPAMPPAQVRAILADLREMLQRAEVNGGPGTGMRNVTPRDVELDEERAAIQAKGMPVV